MSPAARATAANRCRPRGQARRASQPGPRHHHRPGKLAIVGGETRLTFAELEAAVSLTAAALAARGLKKGGRLALLSHNCWQFVVLSFATARLGVVLVPVNFMLGPAEIAYILGHSRATAFVAEDGLAATAGQAIKAAGFDVHCPGDPRRAVRQRTRADSLRGRSEGAGYRAPRPARRHRARRTWRGSGHARVRPGRPPPPARGMTHDRTSG